MKSPITLYIHQLPGQPQRAITCDMSDWPATYGALLGTITVEVEWPEIEANPTALLIERYEQQIEQEQVQHTERVGELKARIQTLLCIEYQTPEADQ
jgi:hypothetical protein